MLKPTRCASAGMVILATGCADVRAQNVADLTADVAPFQHLREVRIGMRLGELMDVRPRLQQLEDVIYGEMIEGYQLHYSFPFPYPYESSDGLPLKDIRAMLEFTSDSSAVEAWRERLPELRRRLGTPTECVQATTSSVRSRRIVWTRDGGEVAFALILQHTGPPNQPLTHTVLLEVRAPTAIPPDTSSADATSTIRRERIPCVL